MTANDVQKALAGYYCNGVRYLVPNVYFFGHPYCETDLLVVKEGNGFVYDIEVKVSRSDFKADFQKREKHEILATGLYNHVRPEYRYTAPGKYEQVGETVTQYSGKRPNRFYFAVPTGMVRLDEVPKYAGLLYVDDNGVVNKVKEAPMLHKDKIEVDKILCRKFYYAFAELRAYKFENGVYELKSKNQSLERENRKQQGELTAERNKNFMLEMEIKNLKKLLDSMPDKAPF